MFEVELGHYLTYHHVTQDYFRRHKNKFDGLVIPLSVSIAFRQGTGGFVLTLGKQYSLDPRTPIFQADFERRFIRPTHAKMAAVHGPTVARIFPNRPLGPSDLSSPIKKDMATRILRFQKEFRRQSAEKVAKYAALLGEEPQADYGGPTFLIPPYFKSSSRSDPWYSTSLELARAGAEEKEDFRFAPVVHITQDFPERQFRSVADDYGDGTFDGLIVYMNDLQEYIAPAQVLRSYATLVRTLSELGKPLFGLFGGYFTLMVRKIGLGSFSNAVGYGEYRDSGYHAGGLPVRRYYIPKLHRYFTDVDAQSIMEIVNESWFRCGCTLCGRRRRITDLSPQELLDHFLNVRLLELEHARTNELGAILDELAQTFSRLQRYTALRMRPSHPYQHLQEWTDALRTFTA